MDFSRERCYGRTMVGPNLGIRIVKESRRNAEKMKNHPTIRCWHEDEGHDVWRAFYDTFSEVTTSSLITVLFDSPPLS